LLPIGKFPRLVLGVAIVAALLLLVDLEFVRSASARLLYSNFLDLAVVLLAALSCFYVARHSSGYARQIWMLLAIALALETVAQGISGYYQSFVPGSAQVPWPSDILFFVWVAPVFMIFLPRTEENRSGMDAIRFLDFLQIAIVAVTLYLYFFYVPALWRTDQPSLLRKILILYIARDLFVSVGFFLRSRTTPPSWTRNFFVVLAFSFLAAVVSDAEYLFTLGNSQSSASWGDLLWMLPYFMVMVLAVKWKQPETVPFTYGASKHGQFFISSILPVGIPLLVIFMGREIAREQLLIAWVAVTASFLCSALRLILTTRRQRRISDSLLAAEKALNRSEKLLSTAFRASPDAFSINSFPNGPYLEVNDGFTRLTGFTRQEVLNKTPLQLNLWIDFEQRAAILNKLEETGEVHEVEFQFRTKAGKTLSGQMSASLVDFEGQVCSLFVVRDVTARKEAESLLRSSEERFRYLVENLQVGIVSYDPQLRILFANQAAVNLIGLPQEQLIGKTVADLGLVALREDGSRFPDELRPLPRAIATKKPVGKQLMGWRLPGRSDITWTLLDAFPEVAANGELQRIIVSFTDLSEQMRTLEALRESEERFRTLVSDLHIGVVLHGVNSKIQFANKAALDMFGYPLEGVLGKSAQELGLIAVDASGKEMLDSALPVRVVLETGAAQQHRVMGFRRAGSEEIIWLFGTAVPQVGANGEILRVIASFADITEMKNAERAIHRLSTQLLKLQDAERRHIGRELHDGLAQTVLAINLNLAQVRQSIPSLEPAAARALGKARELTQQMSREIRTLSYLLHPPLLDDLGLASALKECVHGFGERSGIKTQVEVIPEFARLPQAVETALFRVVQESLANIQRHSGSSTSEIRLHRDEARVTLEVIDTGQGMTMPLNGNHQPHEARLGVGIPGMRERMAQLGGRLEIISGKTGTTVRATIPVSEIRYTETDDERSAHSDRG
jgi:PAS domain S-box-containing protein